jgi:hypothetical protein
MDTRFQPSRSGRPRNEAALEEIRRLFERYRAHPHPRSQSILGRRALTVTPSDAERGRAKR